MQSRKSVNGLMVASACALTLVVFPPLTYCFLGFDQSSVSFFKFAALLGCAAALTTLLLYGLIEVSGKFRDKTLIALTLITLIIFVESNIVIVGYPSFDGETVEWEKYGRKYLEEVIALIVMLGMLILTRDKFVEYCPRIGVGLIVIQAIFTLFILPYMNGLSIDTLFEDKFIDEAVETEVLSKNKNIVILIIDTLQSQPAFTTLERDELLRDGFSGFTQYINASTEYPYTNLSVPAVLSGKPYLNDQKYKTYLLDSYLGEESILYNAMKAGYYVELTRWGIATPIPYDSSLYSNRVEKNSFSYADIKPYVLTGLYSILPHWGRVKIHQYLSSEFLSGTTDSNYSFHKRARGAKSQLIDQNVLKLIHLKGLHVPFSSYEPQGVLGDDKGTIAPNRENYLSLTKSILEDIHCYIGQLKQLGVYENSTIMVLGDHGSSLQRISFDIPQHWIKPGELAIGGALQLTAMPAVLVKMPGDSGDFKRNNNPLVLRDLNCTINTLVKEDRKPKPPNNLCTSDSEQRKYYFPRNADLDFFGYFKDMRIADIAGPVYLESSWKFPPDILTRKGLFNRELVKLNADDVVKFGIDGNAETFQQYGWGDPREGFTWTSGSRSSLELPVGNLEGNALVLKAKLVPFLVPNKLESQKVDIFAGGLRIDSWNVSNPGEYQITIPNSRIDNGVLRIAFDLKSATSQKALGLNSDSEILSLQFHDLKIASLSSR
jgi:hypothetical protein